MALTLPLARFSRLVVKWGTRKRGNLMTTLPRLKSVKTMLLVTLIASTLACGYSSKNTPPAAGNVPAIAQLAPASRSAGSGAFTLTVNGSKFNTNAVVNWSGTAQSTTYVSGGQLSVAIPASAIATAGMVPVTVTNPGTAGTGMYGSGGTMPETSNSMTFTIN
jgi:IPT/TIG domain